MFVPLRAGSPSAPSPPAPMTLALCATNAVVFAFMGMLDAPTRQLFLSSVGAVPLEIMHAHAPYSVVTAMFVHGDVWHLMGNLWFLWVFGAPLERALGSFRLLAFFAVTGLAAAILQILAAPDSTVPMIGASGAIAGVLGGYGLTFPRARVRCLVFLLFFVTFATLPASLLVACWLLLQLISAESGQPGVAWFAHIGGLLAGIALVRFFYPCIIESREIVAAQAGGSRALP